VLELHRWSQPCNHSSKVSTAHIASLSLRLSEWCRVNCCISFSMLYCYTHTTSPLDLGHSYVSSMMHLFFGTLSFRACGTLSICSLSWQIQLLCTRSLDTTLSLWWSRFPAVYSLDPEQHRCQKPRVLSFPSAKKFLSNTSHYSMKFRNLRRRLISGMRSDLRKE